MHSAALHDFCRNQLEPRSLEKRLSRDLPARAMAFPEGSLRQLSALEIYSRARTTVQAVPLVEATLQETSLALGRADGRRAAYGPT